MFYYEYCEIFNNTFLTEYLRYLCWILYDTLRYIVVFSSYNTGKTLFLLFLSGKLTMNLARERLLYIEVNIPGVNQVTKILRSFGPKIWNSLPHHVKSAKNLEAFRNY